MEDVFTYLHLKEQDSSDSKIFVKGTHQYFPKVFFSKDFLKSVKSMIITLLNC